MSPNVPKRSDGADKKATEGLSELVPEAKQTRAQRDFGAVSVGNSVEEIKIASPATELLCSTPQQAESEEKIQWKSVMCTKICPIGLFQLWVSSNFGTYSNKEEFIALI